MVHKGIYSRFGSLNGQGMAHPGTHPGVIQLTREASDLIRRETG
jgi:hypothetical protein